MWKGLGGDCFLLFYDAKQKNVFALNGSGRSPAKLTLKDLLSCGFSKEIPATHIHTVTVPGAAAGWCDTVEHFGSGHLLMKDILAPAIKLANSGFPVSEITSLSWRNSADKLMRYEYGCELLLEDNELNKGCATSSKHATKKYRGPRAGEIFKNPGLANVMKEIAKFGKSGFYGKDSWVAQSIINTANSNGSKLSMNDLTSHSSIIEPSINVEYKDKCIHEVGPNSQGLCALIALNILETMNIKQYKHNTAIYLHVLIETMRIAFADARYYVGDPQHTKNYKVLLDRLLSKDYASNRRKLINC